jgi:hypothetical protein
LQANPGLNTTTLITLWLADQEEPAVALLTQHEALPTPAIPVRLGIQEIFAGNALRNKWNDPGGDPRNAR